ncbi:hypothetical protein HK100_010614 [Physocladia obscura]|uniref:Protein kinase domain-containing protein n=1 Tax=Physocladia obscura TaxID=109957 RepID=A0AAD5T3I0_9FUNG|nr:hypothetical protein HK100_010614 [Physocladia obscura]
MVTEYCAGGEAFDHLCQIQRMPDTDPGTRRMFREIVEAVGYCHAMNFVHRDLKLENVLLTPELAVKVIDFGFMRPYNERNLLDTYCGSIGYAAPEMITGKKYSGPRADIWSLGVILYTLLCGYLPFDDDNEAIVHQKINTLDYELPDFLSDDSKSLISQILQIEPDDRISVPEILQHPWFMTNHHHASPLSAHTTQPPGILQEFFTTREEVTVCASLLELGFDVPRILESVCGDACDSASALWHLLVAKETEKRRRSRSSSSVISVGNGGVVDFLQTQRENSVGSNNSARARSGSGGSENDDTTANDAGAGRINLIHPENSNTIETAVIYSPSIRPRRTLPPIPTTSPSVISSTSASLSQIPHLANQQNLEVFAVISMKAIQQAETFLSDARARRIQITEYNRQQEALLSLPTISTGTFNNNLKNENSITPSLTAATIRRTSVGLLTAAQMQQQHGSPQPPSHRYSHESQPKMGSLSSSSTLLPSSPPSLSISIDKKLRGLQMGPAPSSAPQLHPVELAAASKSGKRAKSAGTGTGRYSGGTGNGRRTYELGSSSLLTTVSISPRFRRTQITEEEEDAENGEAVGRDNIVDEKEETARRRRPVSAGVLEGSVGGISSGRGVARLSKLRNSENASFVSNFMASFSRSGAGGIDGTPNGEDSGSET